MDEVDLVVIGAGIYGLTTASTYHRLHPDANILIVDSAPHIGGPWAPYRIFPGLVTNNLWGMYEHPDFPMGEARFGVKKGEHVPAAKMLEYIEAMVEWSGIGDFVQLNTKVDVIEKKEAAWTLQCTTKTEAETKTFAIHTKQLVISVGTTNKTYMPNFSTSPDFTPPIVHSKDFPSQFSQIAKPYRHTLIIGSGKSAWDVAYACASQPTSTASILIRPSGNGPNYLAPTHVTPFKLWLEKLVFTRFFGFMSPCPWAETAGIEGWLRSFFHETWLGRKVTAAFWNVLGEDVVTLNKLDGHPETKKLRPWRGGFEVGNCLGIHNYPTSFFDLVREGRIKVVIDEVGQCSKGREVLLKSGNSISVDAVVCATGWQIGNALEFKPKSLEASLGMPFRGSDTQHTALIKQSEDLLYSKYPFLKDRDTSREFHPDPSLRYTQTSTGERQPYRLHRFIVPPSTLQDRSIVFNGALHTLGTFPCAYIQSLWITAYLDGSLALPVASEEQILAETYRNTQYFVIRGALGLGATLPDMVFDTLPYFDLLLRDLGLEGKRKGRVLGLRECVRSYGPEDWRGLVDEWEVRQGGEGKKHN